MSDNFIKVHLDDSRNKKVSLREVEPIGSNIKVVRQREQEVSSESSYSSSEMSSEESFKVKKTKKILRKKQQQPNYDFGSFSNPKKTRHDEVMSDSEYSDITESEYSESVISVEQKEKNDFEEKQKLKQDLLIKIQALEKKGFEFSKKFNMTSSYEEMEFEFSKVKKFIDTQAGIKFARRALMACVTGIEFLNKRFDPFSIKLEGWSENVMESMDDYDNIFEKLHEKYSKKAEIAPEIELLLTLGGSAFMFHLTNSLLKSPMMNFGGPVAQNNPNFMASMMGAMNQGLKEAAKPPNFKQSSTTGPPAPMETRGMRKEMRGPSMDSNLFNGTPLATNHPNQVNNFPKPPGPALYPNGPMNNYYANQNDDDRFSIASSDSTLSSVSVGPKTKIIKNKKNSGIELNID